MEEKQLNGYKIQFYSEDEMHKEYENGNLFDDDLLYFGRVSEIREDLAKSIVDNKFKEFNANDIPIHTYKNYAGIKVRVYPETAIHRPMMREVLDYHWRNGGCQTTEYWHVNAKDSFLSISKLDYCVIKIL